MKSTKFTGTFINSDNHQYTLTCTCFGFFEAFFILTAEAIRSGRHYQFSHIEDEKGERKFIDNVNRCRDMIL